MSRKNTSQVNSLVMVFAATFASVLPYAVSAGDTSIKIDSAPVPARYAARLPSTLRELTLWVNDSNKYPPLSHVVDHVLAADNAMMERMSAAAADVPNAESIEWSRRVSIFLQRYEVSKAFCTAARKIMAAPPSNWRAAVAPMFADKCATPNDAPLIVRRDTPGRAVIAYYDFSHDYEILSAPPGFDVRLAEAVRESIFDPKDDDYQDAAIVLVSQVVGGSTSREERDPRAVQALLQIHSEIKDSKRADAVALAFRNTKSIEGKRRADLACRRRKDDPICTGEYQFATRSRPIVSTPPSLARIKSTIAKLNVLGFSRVAALDPKAIDTDHIESVLEPAGYSFFFDIETDQFPNHHDTLMRSLATLVTAEFKDAIFEEQAPDIDSETPYALTAYVDGKRYRTLAENLGDWYDVDAVLRLMNSILVDSKSTVRYRPLETRDQNLTVVAAPTTAFAAAVNAGILRPGNTSDAEKTGKASEERVIKLLQK